jgi:mRNA interferase MazF
LVIQFVPDRGHAIWLDFNPQAGHEQAGRRPAIVLSPASYNKATGMAMVCPITSQIKGNPFEVLLPEGLAVHGAILSNQMKSLDWKERNATLICRLPAPIVNEVIYKLWTIIKP